MSQRARVFVEYWTTEFLHPDTYEEEETHGESRANALECLKCAAICGIAKDEIEEEYGDLVAHIARLHEKIVDADLESKRTAPGLIPANMTPQP